MNRVPKIIAHRGASKYAPENTLVALRLAKQQGATWVEFDVQLTADEQVVVIHDELIDRTSNGKGAVVDYTLAELQQFDFGGWFDDEFSGETIPSLRQWLLVAQELNLALNIELKPAQPGHRDRLVELVVAELDLFWSADINATILVSSFDWGCLERFKQLAPEYNVALLAHEWSDDKAIQLAQQMAAVAINLNEEIITAELFKKIKSRSFSVLAYTVNDEKRAKQLFAMGVDGLFSDDPLLLVNKT